ncbi:MAG TPA: RagB/SusD family nutrient uptake outer membrane protein [Chitinophaga sp.]|uniref:RagB/SusD family nutrient uptake outer membrane protein n=1 Tax=Chitinophaga sp. TaxID=1869181 RepID=UPI002CCEBD83|nr:RagB/SusD family nutrient uptake outer membrane protein [Chitinophaga sp.]HVI44199.1 RagB/SusD family nutrient uptake outer membrane protein [Chitinophaga sp.]
MKTIGRKFSNRLISSGILAIILCCSGCKKFLEQSSPDEFIPATIADLQKVLAREGYPPANRPFHPYFSLLDDDVKCVTPDPYASNWKQGQPAFTWSRDLYSEMQINGDRDADTYGKYYQRIKGCNVVLDMIRQAKGEQAEKDQLEGQARVLRAYYYFMLVNLYGWPYNDPQQTPDKSMGVPLVLTGKVADACLRRNSVEEVYNQIVSDITQGAALLEKANSNDQVFCIGRQAAWLLASRIFLYMNDWKRVIENAGRLLSERPALEDIHRWAVTSGRDSGMIYPRPCYIDPSNKEIIFLFGCIREYGLLGTDSVYNQPCYYPSDTLSAAYEKGDLRADVYINSWRRTGIFSKVNYKGYLGKSFRTAEAYLNRAEALIRTYIRRRDAALLDQAVTDLNFLRKNRFEAVNFKPLSVADFGSVQELLSFCLQERRRELCFEEHRWFDLRRYGMPAITHFYYQSNKQKPQAYQLPERSSSYVLPIPDIALTNNPMLIQNP